MEDAQIAAVGQYLRKQFPGTQLEHQADADIEARAWKVLFEGGNTLLVKFTDELVSDTPANEIAGFLDQMRVGEALRQMDPARFWLLVTSDRIETRDRS